MEYSNKPTLQVRHMGWHTNPQHRSQPAQEPNLPYTRQPSCGATQTNIINDREDRVCVQHGVCRKCGWTEVQSAVLQSPTSVRAGQATLISKS